MFQDNQNICRKNAINRERKAILLAINMFRYFFTMMILWQCYCLFSKIQKFREQQPQLPTSSVCKVRAFPYEISVEGSSHITALKTSTALNNQSSVLCVPSEVSPLEITANNQGTNPHPKSKFRDSHFATWPPCFQFVYVALFNLRPFVLQFRLSCKDSVLYNF